jgi:hypothetical protein
VLPFVARRDPGVDGDLQLFQHALDHHTVVLWSVIEHCKIERFQPLKWVLGLYPFVITRLMSTHALRKADLLSDLTDQVGQWRRFKVLRTMYVRARDRKNERPVWRATNVSTELDGRASFCAVNGGPRREQFGQVHRGVPTWLMTWIAFLRRNPHRVQGVIDTGPCWYFGADR